MLLQLPTFNAALSLCPIDKAEFAAHPQGFFCGQCQRVVHDFSYSATPAADLAAARAAAPDGRVCGRFGAAQVHRPKLTQRLRWFVVALGLVVGQGLSARGAWAQVRKSVPQRPATRHPKQRPGAEKQSVPTLPGEELRELKSVAVVGLIATPDSVASHDDVLTYAEQMPQLPDGGGNRAIVAYIQERVRQPRELKTGLEGRVFVSFVVGKDGLVREAQIVRYCDGKQGLSPESRNRPLAYAL